MKRSFSQNKFGMGYVKMHGFHGKLLYDSRDWDEISLFIFVISPYFLAIY